MCDDHVCDMHNRLLCIVILLQLVVDSNCYYWYQYGGIIFTSDSSLPVFNIF